nr:accessory Sec system glycosyltransferase GtfA [Mammaliicoccus sp. Marseille-Q6498]
MTIYNINYGIGWASSGVEYAQMYRAEMLRAHKEPSKFVFLDFISQENIQTLTSNMGFYDDEIIWLYQYFTDIKIAPTSYTVDDLIEFIDMEIIRKVEEDKRVKLIINDNQTYIVCYLKEKGKPYVDRAEFVSRGKLYRKDFYSYTRVCSEYYGPCDNRAKLYMRQFYNEDGSIAYNEYINGEGNLYKFKDKIIYSKYELIGYFMEKLALTNKDIVIVDRSKGYGQPVIKHKGQAKLGIVVHAEHYSENITNDDYILWNNHYEYVFSNAKEIDFYITATERQRDVLSKQFKKYNGKVPFIYTIPVGSIDELIKPAKRRPYSIMTASRLASEKHIDWLIKAVVIAQQSIPELKFDIYGEGGKRDELTRIISEKEASHFISLYGHVNLKKIYANYELFLSGSTSEGFGLTLMEAVGSGLGMIGFDVDYGNTTFINHNKNGYVVPIELGIDSEEQIVNNLANSIIQFFKYEIGSYQKQSYAIAENFKKEQIQQKWFNLIEEVLHD